MIPTFKISNTPTEYKEVLESVNKQGEALRFVHNPNTWRLSTLTFSLHLNDSIIMFNELKVRWKTELPFVEAWDVNFGEWINTIWSTIHSISSISTTYDDYKIRRLCDLDYVVYMEKAQKCIDGEIPINDVINFLKDKNTKLEQIVWILGEDLTGLLKEIEEMTLSAPSSLFVQLYEEMMGIYMAEYGSNPYPIDNNGEIITFDRWISSKSEKQRIKHISQRINSVNTTMLEIKFWKEVWEDNVDIHNHEIDKDGLGRAIFTKRSEIIGNNSYPCKSSMYKLFSSLALCEHLWEYETSQNLNAYDNLTDSRKEIVDRLEMLIDKGDWVAPASTDVMKSYIRLVLGVGTKKLIGDDKVLSDTLWSLLELGKKDRVRIVFQNMIGYFMFYKLLPEGRGTKTLNCDFFGNNAPTYQNINHGKPGNVNMPADFNNILPLLDKYRPKKVELDK
jgi:hypothetical protein